MSCINQLDETAKQNLLSSIFSKNFFLWIGSGFSYNFGYGSWDDVLNKVKNTIGYTMNLDTSNPLRAAELLCSFALRNNNIDEYGFNSIVADSLYEIKRDVDDPDWKRRFRHFAPKMIVTTNWDTLLEQIFDGIANVIIRGDKCPQVSSEGRNIFKIHGDIGRPSSIVVTQSQYFCFQREDTYLNRKIYTLFTEASPIFLGYSLTDPNIGFIYDEVYAHLGEEKPPAFMIVHPSTAIETIEESKLLFTNKKIHIIKAEISEFLKDVLSEFRGFKQSTKRFMIEHKNIVDRLLELLTMVQKNENFNKEKVLSLYNTTESRLEAMSALIEILDHQILYQEFNGKLLSPENRISYREIDEIISSVIWLRNEERYPDDDIRETFYKSVMNLCANSDGVWDFNTAERPFVNVLRISPGIESNYFEARIKHIIDVIRWSSPDEIGKCWATWKAFCKYIDWFSENDIDEIIHVLNKSEDGYRRSDGKWLEKVKGCKKCTESQKVKINELITK